MDVGWSAQGSPFSENTANFRNIQEEVSLQDSETDRNILTMWLSLTIYLQSKGPIIII